MTYDESESDFSNESGNGIVEGTILQSKARSVMSALIILDTMVSADLDSILTPSEQRQTLARDLRVLREEDPHLYDRVFEVYTQWGGIS